MILLLAVGTNANGHNLILVWAVVESENRAFWEYFLRLLRQAIPEVSSEPCVLVSTAYFPSSGFGHLNSNIAESINRLLKSDRELTIVDLLNAIWHRVMDKRSDRLRRATEDAAGGMVYTSYAMAMEGRKWAQSNAVSGPSVLRLY